MCGRYAFNQHSVTVVTKALRLKTLLEVERKINHAPTMQGPIALVRDGEIQMERMRWGLVVPWTKAPVINAQSESAMEKKTFRQAIEQRRCLIIADAFYEWEADKKPKQPWEFRLADDQPLVMAGMWSSGRDPEGEKVEAYTVLTTQANETLQRCHDRMPVILSPEDWEAWLDPAREAEQLKSLWKPWTGPMEARPVTTAINKVSFQEGSLELKPSNTDEAPKPMQGELF